MMMATTAEHYRIKILDWGGDGWRWHLLRSRPAEFRHSAAAHEKVKTLRAFHLENDAVGEDSRVAPRTAQAAMRHSSI